MLPSRRDRRAAFILPRYVYTRAFGLSGSRRQQLARFATILGFVGMLRPHTFSQVQPASFKLVIKDREGLQPPLLIKPGRGSPFAETLRSTTTTTLGFLLKFKSKTQLEATTYYPNLSACTPRYQKMCPVRELANIVESGGFTRRFLQTFGKGNLLAKFLKEVVNEDLQVSRYALRIGGRTWYLSQHLDKQFVDYLGTWASSEASARYYRASPEAVLKRLQSFFEQLDD